MRETVLRRLCCPACRGTLQWQCFTQSPSRAIEDGVVWCTACRRWYPIDGELLELLPATLAYRADRQRFWDQHRENMRRLELTEDTQLAHAADVESQRKQQEHFDWYAANEEQTYTSFHTMPFWSAVDGKVFAQWRRAILPGKWVLDVGCAQGRSSARFMDLPVNIVGFDISKALVRQAIASSRQGHLRAVATFFVADGANFPIREESFDYVVTYGVLHHLPDPAATCREVARVLRRGGTYFVSENNVSVFRSIFDWLMKVNPIWHEEAGAQPMISEGELRHWFSEAHFAIRAETHIFVPPHLVNMLGRRVGTALVDGSDRIGSMLPVIRRNGGLLTARIQRRLTDLDLH